MQTILVTGGAGFVGSRLAMGLKAHREGVRVVALDNLKRRGSELNLPRLRAAGVEFVFGDIRQPADLDEVGKIDLILECSAEPSVLAGYGGSPRYVIDTNLGGTINCLEVARRHGAAFLFLSTSRVYPIAPLAGLSLHESATRFEVRGPQTTPGLSEAGIAETFPLEGTRSMYGATKLASELVLAEYLEMYNLRGLINRCGVLAGPWQMGKIDQGVVVLWLARHVFGGALSYIGFGGNGKQVRDMLHIDDLLDLVLHQIDHLDALSGKTFNVGGGLGVSASLCELTALCREITGVTLELGSVAETRPADIPWYVTDNARITAATGWAPKRDVTAILTDTHSWLREHRDLLASILG
jgi:CDP-paratose 2-epimerase